MAYPLVTDPVGIGTTSDITKTEVEFFREKRWTAREYLKQTENSLKRAQDLAEMTRNHLFAEITEAETALDLLEKPTLSRGEATKLLNIYRRFSEVRF